MPQHVVVVQVRGEPRGAARGRGGEKGTHTRELIRIPAGVDDERLPVGDHGSRRRRVAARGHDVHAGGDLDSGTRHLASLGGEQLYVVRGKRAVARNQDKRVEFCLCDEHAIEGVRAMQRKRTRAISMAGVHGKE